MFEKLNENLVQLNKKQTKVILTWKARAFGIVAKLVEFGIPLIFVALKYGLFKKGSPYSITGGTIFAFIILYAFLQNYIKEAVKRFDSESSETMKRGKWVVAWLGLSLFVWIGSVFLDALLMLFMVGAFSVALSLIFWKPYDSAIAQRKELEELLKKEKGAEKLEQLKKLELKD